MIEIHVFGDASLLGIYAVANTVIQQPFGIKQGLIVIRSRFEIRNSFPNYNIREVCGWSDRTLFLN